MTPSANQSPVEAIRLLMERSPELRSTILHFSPGDIILQENQSNQRLYILLEGQIDLIKRSDSGKDNIIDQFQPGALLGLLSFWSQDPTFTSSQALTKVECLCLEQEIYQHLLETDSEFKNVLNSLIISNLVDRYRRVVNLNVEVQSLTQELQEERNRLQKTVEDLHRTRDKLINQEKLATLGQLFAGIAHEMNNPCAALSRSSGNLNCELTALFKNEGPFYAFQVEGRLLELGMESPFLDSEKNRERMTLLSERYPNLKRSLIRKLAQLPIEGIELLEQKLDPNKNEDGSKIQQLLIFFDIGLFLRSICSSTERIHKLITSLKNYSRPPTNSPEYADIHKGIYDTLLLLNNRLKHYSVKLELSELPQIECYLGEINQVWTNILTNACDAMPPEKSSEIIILSGLCEDNCSVWIEFRDNGPGIPSEILSRIFDPNFTTKSRGQSFGLGLGLSISKSIIKKHHGKMTVSNLPHGGAVFQIKIPIHSNKLNS
ncbi:MAG: ATP-binding protein [Verrucomicrobiota bacterium]